MRKVNSSIFIVITVIAVSLLFGCITMGGRFADGSYISTVEDIEGYRNWHPNTAGPITGDPTGFLGPAHESAEGFREIWINNAGAPTSDGKGGFPYQAGTIVVKESRAEENGDLKSITVMIKRGKTYDPDNGNWEYMMITPAMEVMAQGKVEMCIGCHAMAADRDYVFINHRGGH